MPEKLVFLGSDDGYAVLAHQPPYATVTDIQAKLFQFFGHSRSTIAVQTQAMQLPDAGQQNHVLTLTRAGRPIAPETAATWCHVQQVAQMLWWQGSLILVNEIKPHGFSLAKKIAAFSALPSPREAGGFPGEGVHFLSPAPDPLWKRHLCHDRF